MSHSREIARRRESGDSAKKELLQVLAQAVELGTAIPVWIVLLRISTAATASRKAGGWPLANVFEIRWISSTAAEMVRR